MRIVRGFQWNFQICPVGSIVREMWPVVKGDKKKKKKEETRVTEISILYARESRGIAVKWNFFVAFGVYNNPAVAVKSVHSDTMVRIVILYVIFT